MIFRGKLIWRSLLVIILVVVAIWRLLPSNKEQYIRKYERFVDQVEKDHESYSEKDWRWSDRRFKKFNSDWYKLYEDNLTAGEKLKVKALAVRYHSFKGEKELTKYRELLKKDVEEIRKKVEDYVENDATEDLEKLKEGAKEIGDSAVKVLENIMKSINKKND